MLAFQSWQTLCDPMDYSPPGSSVHGILQARILELVATSFSRGIFLTQAEMLVNTFTIVLLLKEIWQKQQKSLNLYCLKQKLITGEPMSLYNSMYFKICEKNSYHFTEPSVSTLFSLAAIFLQFQNLNFCYKLKF